MTTARPYRNVFATVGSTKFDGLIQSVCDNINTLAALGCKRLVLQIGRGSYIPPIEKFAENARVSGVPDQQSVQCSCRGTIDGVEVVLYRTKPSIADDMDQADLIISHAGAGTILEALELSKVLVVVTNDALMHNHQRELADAMQEMGCLLACTPSTLAETLPLLHTRKFKKLEAGDPSLLTGLLMELAPDRSHRQRRADFAFFVIVTCLVLITAVMWQQLLL